MICGRGMSRRGSSCRRRVRTKESVGELVPSLRDWLLSFNVTQGLRPGLSYAAASRLGSARFVPPLSDNVSSSHQGHSACSGFWAIQSNKCAECCCLAGSRVRAVL